MHRKTLHHEEVCRKVMNRSILWDKYICIEKRIHKRNTKIAKAEHFEVGITWKHQLSPSLFLSDSLFLFLLVLIFVCTTTTKYIVEKHLNVKSIYIYLQRSHKPIEFILNDVERWVRRMDGREKGSHVVVPCSRRSRKQQQQKIQRVSS